MRIQSSLADASNRIEKQTTQINRQTGTINQIRSQVNQILYFIKVFKKDLLANYNRVKKYPEIRRKISDN
jgi:hypothetical protein